MICSSISKRYISEFEPALMIFDRYLYLCNRGYLEEDSGFVPSIRIVMIELHLSLENISIVPKAIVQIRLRICDRVQNSSTLIYFEIIWSLQFPEIEQIQVNNIWYGFDYHYINRFNIKWRTKPVFVNSLWSSNNNSCRYLSYFRNVFGLDIIFIQKLNIKCLIKWPTIILL